MAVPVESHARPIQKKMRCERFSVPELAFAENADRVGDKGEGDYRGGGDKNR